MHIAHQCFIHLPFTLTTADFSSDRYPSFKLVFLKMLLRRSKDFEAQKKQKKTKKKKKKTNLNCLKDISVGVNVPRSINKTKEVCNAACMTLEYLVEKDSAFSY